MQKLALLCKTKEIGDAYRKELLEIFQDYLEITVLFDEYNLQAPIELGSKSYDIILVTNVYSLNKSRHLIKNDPALIYLDFAFQREPIEQLRTYPVGTDALICFNYCSSSHQAASALYDVGVRNLNLYVNYPQNKNLVGKHFALALTSNQPGYTVPDIPEIFDLGRRKIALSTVLEIAIQANLLDEEVERRIYEYRESIAVPRDYLDYSFNHSIVHKFQFQDIANCLEDPLIILDQKNVVKNCNTAFLNLLGEVKPLRRPLAETQLATPLKVALLESNNLNNHLVEIPGESKGYLVSKQRLNKQDPHTKSYLVTIKDISRLRNLESNLKRQMKKRGYVTKYNFSQIKGECPQFKEVVQTAQKISGIDKPTLILGESGTGKELFAQSIHANSARRDFPFIGVNCAALPDNLLESELFGYDEGAFTGARRGGKAGLFELANHGTLFLDEIGDLPLMTQAKLLRVLEEGEIMRVGGDTILTVDVRILAATNRDLDASVQSGSFRMDLFYRLNNLMILVPPLRERREDIPILIDHFLARTGQGSISIDQKAIDFLTRYDWQGNIRELRSCVEYMAAVAVEGKATLEDLPMYIKARLRQRKACIEINRGTDLERVILTLLGQGPMGRDSLLRMLSNEGIDVTEYRLRVVLKGLEQRGLITISQGRRGCALTSLGKNSGSLY